LKESSGSGGWYSMTIATKFPYFSKKMVRLAEGVTTPFPKSEIFTPHRVSPGEKLTVREVRDFYTFDFIITPAIKHVNKFCGIPVFPENGDHALIYLVAGVIIVKCLSVSTYNIAS
jgi:hypothetical protein